MTTTMNTSGYEIERETGADGEYGDEVMYAGWNPQLASAGNQPVGEDKHPALPGELATVDIDAFLQKMYKYQR
ncbi:hypothetical protein GALL_146100 [mine drainage metagenome]|uniref:Uncharacterized protein n=1 Tax=mine drainage metagenome TaxID=410659 RepID=A0A1J5S5F4_9ZZZZ